MAHALGISEGLVNKWQKAGKLRFLKLGRCVRIPQEEVDRINAAGGCIKGSKGVDPLQYLPAAKLGVCKVNIDTDGRLVWTRVHREFFRDKPAEFDLRPVGKIFMAEYAAFIASRNEFLGSAGNLDGAREHAQRSLGK